MKLALNDPCARLRTADPGNFPLVPTVLYLAAAPPLLSHVPGGAEIDWTTDVDAAVARAIESHVDVVLVDVDAADPEPLRRLDGFLAGQRAERDRELRFRRDRVLAVVHGDGPARERALFALGERRLGGWVRGPHAAGGDLAKRAHGADLANAIAAALQVPPSRKALCAAGGGITGVYYELGVLKCLEDTFGGFSVHDFDMYFGISAGAIVSSLVANGVSLDELLVDLDPSNRAGVDLELRLRELTIGDLPGRILSLWQHAKDYRDRVRRGEERFGLTAALSQLAALMGPFFRGDSKSKKLAEILSEPGRTNDFRELSRELYIGATDQDRREHVLFGAEPYRHVPIHKAVQASAAIHPFLAPVDIDGRRYTDGFVTRTTNIAAAVERRANLIVVVDPFLPYVSETPGFHHRHSLFWVLVQDYKTVAFTRYENAANVLAETEPRIACVSFLPSNRMRRLLASNPISTGNFDPIVSHAYASTYRRLERNAYRMAPALAEHGIELRLDRAAKRVGLLDALPAPRAAALCA
jgi:predicted acylesterase/phospholipase RssA